MKIRTPNYYMVHICLWDRNTLENDGCCSHCTLNEGIHGDFDLSDEQREAQAIEKEKKRRALKADWYYKQREENYHEYMDQMNEGQMQSQQLRAGPNASKILHRKGFTRGYVPL